MVRPERAATIALNALLLGGIIYKFVDDPPVNERGWIWLALFLGCPAMNLLGLSGAIHRTFTLVAAFINGAGVLVWGVLIALMMVWPMGNKPKGIEVVVLIGSWLVLVLTEVVLVRMAANKRSH